MTEGKAPRKVPVGLTIATAISLAILLSLGAWQMKRLAWKEDLLARIAALQAAPAQPIAPALARKAKGEDVDFTRVEADCPGLATAPWVELYALRDGQAGVRLISACKLSGAAYASVLVDRGFVGDTVSARPPRDAANLAPFHVVGVLRSPDKPTFVTPPNDLKGGLWYSRDVAAMARRLGAGTAAPVFLFAETATNPEWKALIPAPVPAEIPNRHLEYALTWFGLAGALLAVYAAMLWRRWKS
jgi:surfeit locus 1 family protein